MISQLIHSKGKYMKKHTAMFLTFSALLTFNAFAPQVFWQESKVARFPAQEIESKLEHKDIEFDKSELLKLPEIRTEKASSVKDLVHEDLKINEIDLLEEIVVGVEERSALKFDIKHEDVKIDKALLEKLPEVAKCEYKEEDLEAKIKSLIDDKKTIMEEIAELKEMKREKAAEKRAELAKKKAPKKREYQSDVLAIMSEFTNLMMSQQQQQMMMMQQMFSMMPQQQRPMGIDSLYSPHSYVPARMEMSYTQQYPLGYSRHEVGIDYVNPHGFQRFERAPSAQYEQRYMQQPAQMPQPMVEQAHEGFNFSQSGSSNMNRVYFN